MQRREFIILVGGAVAIWPLAARAQQVKTWRIGFLSPADGPGPNHQAFVQQLKKLGYEEGINLRIEWRWLHQQYADLPQMAADLTRQNLDVLVAQTQAVALAAKKATQTVPIIFVGVRDPVAAGLVESMNRPGGNVTGVTLTPNAELVTKQIEILAEMLPNLHQMAVLWNPDVAVQAQVIEVLKNLSQPLGLSIKPVGVSHSGDIERAFESFNGKKIDAIITLVESFTLSHRELIAQLALTNNLPTSFEVRDYVAAGGLVSYGLPYLDHYAQGATFVSKILKGASPSDLPVEQPTKFELVINLKTAKALGLTVPPTLLARADEVIE